MLSGVASLTTLVCIAALGLVGGMSMLLAAALDVTSVLTMHVRWFYTGSARIYMHQLRTLAAFWRLFRGKKWNVLRSRIDSCDYDIDQLLLGTVLFTVLFFLFPTIAVYYVYFSLLRLGLAVAQELVAQAINLFNHLPIYSLVLYVQDPTLFTGTIWLERVEQPQQSLSLPSSLPSSFWTIQVKPVGMVALLHHFSEQLSQSLRHYSLKHVLSCVLSGTPW